MPGAADPVEPRRCPYRPRGKPHEGSGIGVVLALEVLSTEFPDRRQVSDSASLMLVRAQVTRNPFGGLHIKLDLVSLPESSLQGGW